MHRPPMIQDRKTAFILFESTFAEGNQTRDLVSFPTHTRTLSIPSSQRLLTTRSLSMQSLQAVLRMQQQQQHKPGLVSRVKRHSAHAVRLSSTLMIVTLADRYKRLSPRLFSDACLVSHVSPFHSCVMCLAKRENDCDCGTFAV